MSRPLPKPGALTPNRVEICATPTERNVLFRTGVESPPTSYPKDGFNRLPGWGVGLSTDPPLPGLRPPFGLGGQGGDPVHRVTIPPTEPLMGQGRKD